MRHAKINSGCDIDGDLVTKFNSYEPRRITTLSYQIAVNEMCSTVIGFLGMGETSLPWLPPPPPPPPIHPKTQNQSLSSFCSFIVLYCCKEVYN